MIGGQSLCLLGRGQLGGRYIQQQYLHTYTCKMTGYARSHYPGTYYSYLTDSSSHV